MTQRRPLPAWLRKPRSAYAHSRSALRSYDYWTAIYWATPSWLTREQRKKMREIYRNRPAGYHVDHEVPLDGSNVCGLNVPWNLRYMRAGANMSKGARWWPDAPHETRELFPREPQPHQTRLPI